MADELPDTASAESAEDRESRPQEFFARMGINDWDFPELLEGAINHATVVRPAAGTPPAHNWFPIGPRNVGGRIRELVQDPTNASTLYAGSAFGGVWRTRDSGDRWEHLAEVGNPPGFGGQNYAVGAMAVPEQHPEVLYVGTGDPVDTFGSGRGLWKFTIPIGLGAVRFERLQAPDPPGTLPAAATPGAAPRYTRIQMDPDEATRFWTATPNGVFQCDVPLPFGSPAVFKSVFPPTGAAPAVPGGAPPLPVAISTPYATDLLVTSDPRSVERVGAAARFLIVYAAISGAGVYRGVYDRTDDTIRWDVVLGIPVAAPFGRVRMALCKTRPQFVYAIFEDLSAAPVGNPTVVYRTSDNGDNWSASASAMPPDPGGGVASYALPLAVHPEKPEIIVSGSVDLYISKDSGDTWPQILNWLNYDNGDRAQHADQHTVLFDALDPHKIWVANDGGISLGQDIRLTPFSSGYWRKRSHGILAAQFQDVTADRALPFLCGGGLQDNGTYIGFGGPTWYHFDGGDGGMIAFDPTNPRIYYTTWQGGLDVGIVVPAVSPPPGTPFIQSPVVHDVPAPFDSMSVNSSPPAGAIPNASTWVGIIDHHPTAANVLMVGRVGTGYSSINGGGAWVPFNVIIGAAPAAPLALAAAPLPPEEVSALAFGEHSSGAAANRDGWMGTTRGQLFVTANAPAGNWRPVVVPWGGADPTPRISRIATHPTNPNVVAICTAGLRGRVMLSYNRGANWREITAPVPAVANQDLPPCPMTSILFDPGSPRDLYVGTLAGVYVLRNLPPQPAGGTNLTTAAAVAAFPIDWRPFNTGLPLTLVNDLAFLPTTGGRRVLRAATFGRGMYDCAVAGAVQHQLYIRQTLIEDGRTYPRAIPALVPDDLRLPAGAVPLDFAHSFDIRLDAPPYSFFEETMDGVEFDEDLRNDIAVPGETNLIYVQVHNSGHDRVPNVAVHLYFRASPAVAFGGAVPALGTPADFWHPPNFDVTGPGTTWLRTGPPQTLAEVGPGRPAVARFEWVPPVALAGTNIALLALCSGPFAPAAIDALPAAPGAATIPALITAQRRAALRVVQVGPFVPDVYIRHGADDHGVPGTVPFGGRSPDIIVVQGVPVDVRFTFRDLNSPRLDDKLRSGTNFIFVRVLNRKNVSVNVDVELFWVKPNVVRSAAEANAPPFDNTQWGHVAPTSTASNQSIPARNWGVVQLQWDNPPDPDATPDNPHRSFLLIALIKTSDNLDPSPVRTRVTTLKDFWTTFKDAADANNAAIRAIRYEP